MTLHKGLFMYGACLFLAVAGIAAVWQLWWLLLLPIALLLGLWAFEKPVLLFYALLAAIPWSVEYQFSDVLGTDFPDEPLMWLNALAALMLLAYHNKRLRQPGIIHPLLWLLLLQLFWAVLTILTSTYPVLSFKYVLAKGWYLLSFVLLPLLLLTTKEKVKQAAVVLVASMSVLVVVVMIRQAQRGFSFVTINESLAPFFRNHVNYSALLVCIIPLLYFFLKGARNRMLKITLGVVLFISLAALYLSFARGAWLALLTGAIAYGLLKKKALLAGFFLTVFIGLAALFWLQQNNRYLRYAHNFNSTIFHTDFAEHLVATYQLKDMSTAERFYRWVAGVRMVKDGWKTGFGPNTFYHNYKSYTIPLFKTWVSANEEHSTVHNYFLLLLIEQGVVGLLLFLMLLAYAFYMAQRLYHTAKDGFWKQTVACVAVVLTMVCTVNFLSDLIETDKVGAVFYVCLAVLMIAHKKIAAEQSDLAAHMEGIA